MELTEEILDELSAAKMIETETTLDTSWRRTNHDGTVTKVRFVGSDALVTTWPQGKALSPLYLITLQANTPAYVLRAVLDSIDDNTPR